MNIRLRRESMNFSQAEVAAQLKLSQHAYSKIESGLTNLSLQRFGEIAEVLRTIPAALLEM